VRGGRHDCFATFMPWRVARCWFPREVPMYKAKPEIILEDHRSAETSKLSLTRSVGQSFERRGSARRIGPGAITVCFSFEVTK
jgi:hypothetical protein